MPPVSGFVLKSDEPFGEKPVLTRKQNELLMFINKRLNDGGVSPSFDEMKEALRLKSKSGIHRLITGLEERGFLRRLPHRARALQDQLTKSGQVTPDLKRSEASALNEIAQSLLAIGDTAGALAAAEESQQIVTELLAGRPDNTAFAHTRRSCVCNGTTTCLLFLPAGFAPLSGHHLIDREIVELAALSDEGREPPRSSATACPRLAARSAILRRNFAPFQRRASAQSGPKISCSTAAFSA